ncbi:uncharacterized protein MONBRDRAFT_31190 [Monosiga brevicollis MX1]|uniref:Cytoplasmic tRNA 2-thiolation protein 2 n=1 Tax=Monosiga brevicollis TaxID=81824 RepID=A9US91_MONBE|nr:uncharacterized protein MONBRDRAFT_31190 [Monosiga brevicollis MX1]EDQ92060.1 predicted protein [Monosiga brevicollis MX1]|eukprot:XP_001743346.1 hypothetical protein [Monosiga brevicollis MX1]
MATKDTASADPTAAAASPEPTAPSSTQQRKARFRLDACKRCREATPHVLLQKDLPYCRDCCIYNVHRKSRSELGKNRMIRQFERIALAFSGGNRSTALLGIIRRHMTKGEHRQLRIVPTVIHIDDGCLFGATQAEHERRAERIQSLANALDYEEVHVLRLEELYRADDEPDLTAAAARVCALFADLSTVTARQDFLRTMKARLLRAATQQLDCHKLMVGDCHDQIAMRILVQTTQGRGGNMTRFSTFCDEVDGTAMLRPLRAISARELGYYNHFRRLEPVLYPTVGARAPEKTSFESLIQAFVANLTVDFPSTTAAIYRTSEKIAAIDRPDAPDCRLCGLPTDPATTSIAQITAKDGHLNIRDRLTVDGQDLTDCLCQGCRGTLLDASQQTVGLPPTLRANTVAPPQSITVATAIIMAGKLPSEVHYYASVINCPAYANNAAYKAVLAPVVGTAASLLPAFQSPVPRGEDYRSLRLQQDQQLSLQLTKSGVSHQRAGDHDKALSLYHRALQLSEHNVEALVAKGTLHTILQQYDRAVDCLKTALRLQPEHVNGRRYLETTYFRRGKYLEDCGKYVDAAEDYSAALELHGPEEAKAQQMLQSVHNYLVKRAAQSEAADTAARASFGKLSPSTASHGTTGRSSSELLSVMHKMLEEDRDERRRHKKHKKLKKKHKSSGRSDRGDRSPKRSRHRGGSSDESSDAEGESR